MSNELYHHGVKGQRWGVRRYQNRDGTLTPRGQAKLEKLRNENEMALKRESYKNEKRINKKINKLQKKLDKINPYSKKANKIQNNIKNIQEKHNKGKQQLKKELKVLKSYSLEDFKKEDKYVAGELAADIALYYCMGASAALVTSADLTRPKTAGWKTKYRNQVYKERYGDD